MLESESCSVLSSSLPPHRLYSPWNSPGQNTGVVGAAPISTGSSQPRDQTQVSHIAGRFFTSQPGKPNTGEGGLSLLQESSWPRNQTRVSYNAGRFFTSWATRKAHWVLAAAKSLQSCPTLCDPIDGSLRGSSVPGILQARTLECIAISFSNSSKCKVEVKLLSPVRLFATP